MKKEEAIKVLEDGDWWHFLEIPYDDPCHDEFFEAFNIVLSALRALPEDKISPPCYRPEQFGDGCAYQCYDGDDEPIDKCKECPLCTSDKHRNQQEPEKNEPLTREELLKMDGQPVWIEFIPDPDGEIKIWALVSVDPEDDEIFLLNGLGGSSAYEEVCADIRAIYRRPPKEG